MYVRLLRLDVVLLLLFTILAASGFVTASWIDKKDKTDNTGTTKQWTIENKRKNNVEAAFFLCVCAILIYSSSFLCSRLSSVEMTLLNSLSLISSEIFL